MRDCAGCSEAGYADRVEQPTSFTADDGDDKRSGDTPDGSGWPHSALDEGESST
jgi:hypothetical protein